MRTKQKQICGTLAVSLAVLGAAYTSAFFSTSIDTNNLITFGNLGLQINETVLDTSGRELVYTGEGRMKLDAGNHVSRIIRLENTGNEPMYVRASIEMTGTDMNGKPLVATGEVSDFALNEEDWSYKEGWYYYNKVLEPGAESEVLMTGVSFDIAEISERYCGGDFTLDVSAQGVQSKNNGDGNVLLVKGWPE